MENQIKRIPRPAGFTALKTREEKYQRAALAILTTLGSFGVEESDYTASFRMCGIPTHVWRKVMVEKLAEGLEEKKMQLGGLYHLSRGTDEIDSLSEYLMRKVIDTPNAHPLMVKELNSLISNRTRLSEAYIKLAQMMKETGGSKDEGMTSIQILNIIRGTDSNKITENKHAEIAAHDTNVLGLNLRVDEKILENTPDLEPIPMSAKKPKDREIEKPKELKKLVSAVISPR
jgi:hypothetical protein